MTGSASQTIGDRAALDERLAERGDDVEDRVAGGEPGNDRRRRDDEQRIQSEAKAYDDDEDSDEWKHARILDAARARH